LHAHTHKHTQKLLAHTRRDIYQSINLSINQSIYLPAYLPTYLIHASIHPPIHPSVHPSIHSAIHPSIHPSVYLSLFFYLSIFLSFCLSLYLSIFLSYLFIWTYIIIIYIYISIYIYICIYISIHIYIYILHLRTMISLVIVPAARQSLASASAPPVRLLPRPAVKMPKRRHFSTWHTISFTVRLMNDPWMISLSEKHTHTTTPTLFQTQQFLSLFCHERNIFFAEYLIYGHSMTQSDVIDLLKLFLSCLRVSPRIWTHEPTNIQTCHVEYLEIFATFCFGRLWSTWDQ